MKKIFVSVGLAALSASSLHAQYSPAPPPDEMARPWSVGLTVRGFYDDNYLTRPKPALSTYGVEVSPSATLNHVYNNSTVNLQYIYDYLYYDRTSTGDSSHVFNASVVQRFSDRFSLKVADSFIVAQQPGVLNPSGTVASPLYAEGNNVHNMGLISLTAGLFPKLDLQLSYQNDLYAYQQTFGDVVNPAGQPVTASRSALLDRMEQLATVNLNWKATTDLTGVLGYTYGHVGYTSPEPIIFASNNQAFNAPGNILSRVRDQD